LFVCLNCLFVFLIFLLPLVVKKDVHNNAITYNKVRFLQVAGSSTALYPRIYCAACDIIFQSHKLPHISGLLSNNLSEPKQIIKPMHLYCLIYRYPHSTNLRQHVLPRPR